MKPLLNGAAAVWREQKERKKDMVRSSNSPGELRNNREGDAMKMIKEENFLSLHFFVDNVLSARDEKTLPGQESRCKKMQT